MAFLGCANDPNPDGSEFNLESALEAATHLPHHECAVLRAVSVRVTVGVVMASHPAEGLVGALTRWRPEGHKVKLQFLLRSFGSLSSGDLLLLT